MPQEIPPTKKGPQKITQDRDEYEAELMKALRGEQAQDEDTPPEPTPFWQKLLYSGKELGRSALRGVEGAVNETGQFIFEATQNLGGGQGAIDAGNRIRKMIDPEAAERALPQNPLRVSKGQVDEVFGPRSDDPIAGFLESATQFLTVFAATRSTGAGSVLSGGVADVAAFDPYEASLSELAAKAPKGTGLHELGNLMSVDADDSPAVARMKRAAEGQVAGKVIDGLVAVARAAGALKIKANPKSTPSQVKQADVILAEADKTVKAAVEGDGKHINVRQNPDGTFRTELDPNSEGAKHLRRLQALDAEEAGGPPVKPAEDLGGPEGGVEAFRAREAAREPADAIMRRNLEQHGKTPEVIADKIQTRGEAEAMRAVGEDAIEARVKAPKAVTPEQSEAILESTRKFLTTKDPAELEKIANGTHFNLSYAAHPDEALATIEAVSENLGKALDEAQKIDGVPVETTIKLARMGLGGLTEAQAPEAIVKRLQGSRQLSTWLLAGDMVMKNQGRKIAQMADVLEARPHDKVALKEAETAINSLFELQRTLAGANSETGRALRILQERANPLAQGDIKFRPEGAEAPKPAVKSEAPKIAGMTQREIRTAARMVKLAGGEPRNVYAVAEGFHVFKQTGSAKQAMEVFANFLLSGPKTPLTTLTSGVATTVFESTARMAAGLLSKNKELFQEGADIMWGNFKYVSDNIKSMWTAFKAGHSLINPQAQHQAIGGLTGTLVRAPGRILMGIDEFIRVSNYRSFVRAKSLRLGRSQGLKGAALEKRVDEDLRAAFDKNTGIAMLGDALKYAEVPTFSGPLSEGTFGKGFLDFTNNHLEAKFIAPFVKASANLVNYAWNATPFLNRFNADARAIMKQGGEGAAVLHARSALAGSIYAFALYQTFAEEGAGLTGRPPSDPQIRAMWMKNHKPYSIKVGGKWVSYRRGDPFGMFLGLVADLGTSIKELGTDNVDAQKFAVAVVASLTSNLANKTYMNGLTQFASAWGEGDANASERWLGNFAGSATVPALVASLNPDDTYREVQSIGDAIIARIPGWSETLDPKHNGFGEPILKAGGYLNRAVNPFTFNDTGRSVEDDILLLEQGITAPPTQEEGNLINLSDKQWDTKGTGKSPYVRWMELIRSPKTGPSLRDDIDRLVRSPAWKNMSAGAEINMGGRRWLRVQGLKERHYSMARRQMLSEYPELRLEMMQIARMKGAAIGGGQEGVDKVESIFDSIRNR